MATLTVTPEEAERARRLSEFKFVKDLESRMFDDWEDGCAAGIAAGVVETMELSAAKGIEYGKRRGRNLDWDEGFKFGIKKGQNQVLDLLKQQRYGVAEIERQLAGSVWDIDPSTGMAAK
ncbi:MAG: hypothetical protein LBS86_04495 [Treponema sp.]|jgi:hypothetical protein|nr:hypothetical protein [Treponema sp.]